MFRKHIVALALLGIASTSGTAFAAEHADQAAYTLRHGHHAAMLEHRHYATVQDARSAQIERFFNGDPPEGWPYYPN